MLDVIVVGAGFGGLHMVYELREQGFSVCGIEAASDVGGAWYWNRYPGARCDVESLVYSYKFSPEILKEWRWTERYAAQPEIKRYLSFVADRLELRGMYHFSNRVESAVFDKEENCWRLRTDQGLALAARYLILATGPISKPVLPAIPGLSDFQGTSLHTALWPHQEPDFTGKRVGVIGTGSSGVQAIPAIAERAGKLIVFVRTANVTVPARNHPLTDDHMTTWEANKERLLPLSDTAKLIGGGDVFYPSDLIEMKSHPATHFTQEERRRIMERRWELGGGVTASAFADVLTSADTNEEILEFLREKVRMLVRDPEVAEALTPRGFYIGTRRITVGTNFHETFNRDNVDVVDVKKHPIERVTAKGVIVNGEEIELDYLVFATGFDALTGSLTSMDLRGEHGETINEVWARGPQTFLGMGIHGFPNMLMIGGPGSPSVLFNVVRVNEFQVKLVSQLLQDMRRSGKSHFAVKPQAQQEWTDLVNETVHNSLFETSNSWYVGANVPGKPRVILAYTGGFEGYQAECNKVWREDYRGLDIR